MALHRRMLLEDRNLTPDLLAACSEEIENFCNSHSIDGNILSCLMDHAVPSHQNFSGAGSHTIGPQCIRQVSSEDSFLTISVAINLLYCRFLYLYLPALSMVWNAGVACPANTPASQCKDFDPSLIFAWTWPKFLSIGTLWEQCLSN